MQFFLISSMIGSLAFGSCYAVGISYWFGLPLGLLLHTPLLLGMFHPAPSWVCPTITHGSAGPKKKVALTFDDGPSPSVTPLVIDILAERRIVATFFCIGRAARRHPEIIRAIAAAGHELGNHSFHHPRHIYLWSEVDLIRDMELTQRTIEKWTGLRPRLYRPPIGFRSFAMARAIRQTGLCLVNFSARARDTRRIPGGRIVGKILRRVKPGGIIVLHDGSDRRAKPDRRAMLEALPRIIDSLRADGFELVTASELIQSKLDEEPIRITDLRGDRAGRGLFG